MRKAIFFSLIQIAFYCSLQSQNVTIKGKAAGAAAKTIAVYAWSDQLTYTQTLIASGKTDTAGNFEFTFKTDETIFAYLKIDFNRTPIYLEPGATYDLAVSCPYCNSPDDKSNPYMSPKELSVTITNADSAELNQMINAFNSDYDDFLLKNYVSIVRRRNKAKLDSFRLKLDKKYDMVKNQYFANLVKYRLATTELMSQTITDTALVKKYFSDKAVLYNNTGYMEFFNEFFKNYITSESKFITGYDLKRTINIEKSYPALSDSLGKDPVLRNEVLRELAALKFLGGIYYKQVYSKEAVLGMFRYIKENSRFQQHVTIAENYIKFFTKLIPGTVAPDFTLKDYTGQSYSLSEFNKDKYVYLFFWTSWCVPCLSEMDLIGKLKSVYGTKIEFVGISADKEFMKYYYFMQDNKYDFTTLHWGNDAGLLEKYDVKAYPAFILIGPDGKIRNRPAVAPSEGLNDFLYDLTKLK